ncbi:MAG: hypothetical protein ACKERG_04005 [Candidatus Hodgkinia cicadicola]
MLPSKPHGAAGCRGRPGVLERWERWERLKIGDGGWRRCESWGVWEVGGDWRRCERWRSGGDGRWRSWELGEGEKKEKTKRKNKSTKRHLHLFSLPKIAPQHQPSDAGSVRGHNKLCAKPKLAASPPR